MGDAAGLTDALPLGDNFGWRAGGGALERDTGAEMYMLLSQTGDYRTVDLVVRSAVAPSSLIPSLRAALRRADPGLPVVEFRTMDQLVDRSVFTRRTIVRLLAGSPASDSSLPRWDSMPSSRTQ